MNFKDAYQKYNEEIKPDEALTEQMRESVGSKRKSPMWTFAVSIAVFCCICFITMPVLADAMPVMGQLLGRISPELAAYFVPVQLSDISQGIRMEVVAINVQEQETQVYVTMQDLEGDRLDETTDLYDSYSLNIPFSCVSHCENLGYDADTKTITFLITISAMEGAGEDWYERIKNDRITFCVREIIGQKTEYEGVEIPVSLTEAGLEPEAMSAHLTGGSASYAKKRESLWDMLDPRPVTRVLRPGEGDQRFPIEGIELTGMGYVDGYLHIQLGVPYALENDNHGYFFLKDGAGNERLYDGKVSFFGTEEETEHIVYEDCIFDISPDELEDYTLYGYFVTSGLHLEGNWQVKFALGQ